MGEFEKLANVLNVSFEEVDSGNLQIMRSTSK